MHKMSNTSGDEVVAPPNWLRELEEKREKKLKARLGHEAGAGSPCLECKEKCPGLDLHFWRKICKICKCGKENHGVNDSDVSDWLQFQLLGNNAKKPHKIRISGPNELELEWTPKGSKEAVERYLKDLPADQLPIKGSNAARERKQLLQKQMPFHDIDPSLCHNLSEEETKQMQNYLSHLKENSVGVGQLLNFQSPVSARLVTQKVPIKTKHDYENIDAFGNHKLAASLEAISQRQKQRLLENGEVLDEFGNPARALYAMLLDKSGSPLKDPMGKPIKATLDLFGNPIFDQAIVDKISPIAKPEFAILLDKNGAPILGSEGNPIKKPIDEISKNQLPFLMDKFGNEVKPVMGLLLDRQLQTVKDPLGSPIKVRMDVYGRPIFDKAMSEVLLREHNGPKYVVYLDKNGAPILGPDGSPIKRPLGNQVQPKFAIFLDGDKNVVRNNYGDPITTYLDAFRGPVISEQVLEELNQLVPSYSVLLDDKGNILESQNFNVYRDVIVDKFDNALRPQYGLLLDEHECPMKDQTGSPIKVPLDPFLRPKYEPYIMEKLGSRHPEYVMFLDRNGAPILDKYGSPIKNIAYSSHEPLGGPQMAILLDKNEKPLKDSKDPNGGPLRAQVDILGRPLDDGLRMEAKYSMPLDQNGVSRVVHPITYLHAPRVVNSSGNGVYQKPQWSSSLHKPDNKFLTDLEGCQLVSQLGKPILDNQGRPVVIKLDHYGCPTMQPAVSGDIQGATLLNRSGPLLDKQGLPVRMKVDRNGATIEGIPVYLEPESSGLGGLPPVVDKYGNVIDPRTGRPINSGLHQVIPNFASMNLNRPQEDVQIPCNVPIGIINDINATHVRSSHDTNILNSKTSSQGNPVCFEDGLTYDIPECHRCKQIIEDNAVVIQIDHSGALWHTSCFKCHGCNQDLADMWYNYDKETDDVYCGRDYAKIRGIPRCNACDELIFVTEYCLTEDMTYHIKHFCCFECDSPLAGQEYLMENNQPVCIACFELLKADRCMACHDIIRPTEQGINLNGDHFHVTDACFACKVCRKSLLSQKMLYRNQVLYCSAACFNMNQ